jgi:hypothetical protein
MSAPVDVEGCSWFSLMSRPHGPRRYDFPRDPAAVLRELRAMREKVGTFQGEVTLQGPIYKACEAIRHKIDDLAA